MCRNKCYYYPKQKISYVQKLISLHINHQRTKDLQAVPMISLFCEEKLAVQAGYRKASIVVVNYSCCFLVVLQICE